MAHHIAGDARSVGGVVDEAAVLLYVAPTAESLDFRSYEQCVQGRTLLYWFSQRIGIAGEIIVLCHGSSEAERLRTLIAREQINAAVFETSQPTRTDALLEFADKAAAADLVCCDPACLLTPAHCFSRLLTEHRARGATVTLAEGLPAQLAPAVIDTRLLRSVKSLSFPALPPDPLVMIDLLKRSRADEEFGLPLTILRARVLDAPGINLQGIPSATPLSNALEVDALRHVVRDARDLLPESPDGSSPLAVRWRDALVEMMRERQRGAIERWRGRTRGKTMDPRLGRVLYASAPSALSGAEGSLCALISALRNSPVEAHALVSLDGDFVRRLRNSGAVVHCPNDDFSVDSTASFFYCLNLLKDLQPSLVHANAVVGHPLIYAATLLGIPLVQHVRVPYPERLSHQLEAATRVIAVSAFVKKRVVALGIPGEKVDVVFNGVDLAQFEPVEADGGETAGAPGKRPYVVTMIARGAPNKRHDLFIEAMEHLRRASLRPVRALILTELWQDPDYCHRVFELIERLQLHDVVSFVGFQRDIRAVLARSEVLVVCSDDEPLSRSALEAMSMRVPVVATNAGGTNEIVQDGQTGLVVEHNNAVRLAEALMRLVGDEDLRRFLGHAARERVASTFSAEVCALNTLRVYERAVGMDQSRRFGHAPSTRADSVAERRPF